jgi:hypothetical protein
MHKYSKFCVRYSETGNVLFMLLIAIALFAALSYAVTNSTRVNETTTASEEAQLDQAVMDSYMACINSGRITLRIMHDCTTINYDPPSEWGVEPKNCHMFHPQGAGCIYQDLGLDRCDVEGIELTDLEIGEGCGNIVYAGESGGNRIYTTTADQGSFNWNNGTSNLTSTGARSNSDGLSNTNTLVGLSDAGAPYEAAGACRALGADWYLPAFNELNLLYTNKDEGVLSGSFNESGQWYWSSSERDTYGARVQRFDSGVQSPGLKSLARLVRCVRRD